MNLGSGLLVLAIFVLIVHSAPANDVCYNAISIDTLPFRSPGTTVGATKEHLCNRLSNAGDVWFEYTPQQDIIVDISLCEGDLPDFNTILYLISGNCDVPFCEQRNNDFCGTASKLSGIKLNNRITYFIVVSGVSGASGSFELRVSESDVTSCVATPITITAERQDLQGTITDIPVELDCFTTRKSAWYSIIPTANTHVFLSTCDQSNFDSIIIVARGSCDSLSCYNSNDNACTSGSSLITDLFRNVQYFIIVTTPEESPSGDSFTLSVTEVAPFNDYLCSATLIESLPYYHMQSMSAATKDLPCSLVSSGPDVWYRFTPSVNYDRVVISTCGSAEPFAVYLASGSSCSDAQCLQGVKDSCEGGNGEIVTSMEAGKRYFIAVSPVSETFSQPYKLTVQVQLPPLAISCPADFTRTAVRSSCKYPGSTGTPLLSGDTGYNVRVTKNPPPPYSVGTYRVVYTAFVEETQASATCEQRVTINKPAGNFCPTV